MKDITRSLIVAGIIGLLSLAGWVVTLRQQVATLESEQVRQRDRIERLVERTVYYHGEQERR